jgi:hypothetical protein
MKRVVSGGTLSHLAMRPATLVDEYLRLIERDVERLSLLEGAEVGRCPSCDRHGTTAFTRLGFTYCQCEECGSFFLSPLPGDAALAAYAAKGEAERFWSDRVLTATADTRALHAHGARARWVAATAAMRLGSGLSACIIGGRNRGVSDLLLESPAFKSCVTKDAPDEEPRQQFDVVVAFSTLERERDLAATLRRYRAGLRQGGLLFVSSISGSGFEVRLLKGRARVLVPPVHLYLMSRDGWDRCVRHAGFDVVEFSTPGELDVEAVADEVVSHGLTLPPILTELVTTGDESVRTMFQEVLQAAGLSSHMQLVAEAR